MRKLTIALGITALTVGAATQAASDAGGYCVDFVNFSDGLHLYTAPDGLHVIGEWVGYEVDVTGNFADGYINVICGDMATCPNGSVWLFKLERSSNTFDMYGWDGVNPPFVQHSNEPYIVTHGQCAFLYDKTGLPSSFAQ
jgi:hypothetical protein